MKFLAQVLMVLVVCLIASPCCAFDENNPQIEISEYPTEKVPLDECFGECSPFYVCGNCIGFSFVSITFLSFDIMPKRVQHAEQYLKTELLLRALPIWQPPKAIKS